MQKAVNWEELCDEWMDWDCSILKTLLQQQQQWHSIYIYSCVHWRQIKILFIVDALIDANICVMRYVRSDYGTSVWIILERKLIWAHILTAASESRRSNYIINAKCIRLRCKLCSLIYFIWYFHDSSPPPTSTTEQRANTFNKSQKCCFIFHIVWSNE